MPKVTFLNPDGSFCKSVDAKVGWTLLEVAHAFDINVEGVCGGGMACSTCHMYIAEKFLKGIPAISEEEEAMLEFAPSREPNSRLGCQIKVNEGLDGLEVRLPEEVDSQF
ncbi:MAG: 2Fe-2S iron-sulfur cluster-binding protein [Sphingomonadales bacterium]